MADMSRKLAILYAAKSTADVRDSIGTQLAEARRLAERDGYEVFGEHSEEAKSAYHGSRGEELVAARESAAALAADGHDVGLFVQHTDRLARGDGKEAQHLAEIVFWARKADVKIRSVQDDYTTENLIMAVVMGERNHEDSKRKAQATAAGQQRTVERGEWRGGILPGGYSVRYEHDGQGRITTRSVKYHDEDHEIYKLIWRLALEGASEQKISLELNRRGAMTRPVRKGRKRQPFTTVRVGQILNCPFYAGMQVLNGELSPGAWPTYVSFEDWTRLRSERDSRSEGTRRKRGRPVEGYLLSELAKCATCGSPVLGRSSYTRKDGVRSRSYVCRAHREYHEDDKHYCPATPWDAEVVDRAVLSELGRLLRDMDDFRSQLESGQRAEREKLERIVAEATEAARVAERAAQHATQEFADAEDADERALLKDAAKAKRADAKRAKARADAALDAMTAEAVEEVDPEAAMRALYRRLAEQLAEAGEDLKVLNATFRESFARFELRHNGDGGFIVVPFLSAEAARRALNDVPQDATVPSLSDDGLGLPAILV